MPKGDGTCVIYLAMLEVSDFKVPVLSLSLPTKTRIIIGQHQNISEQVAKQDNTQKNLKIKLDGNGLE